MAARPAGVEVRAAAREWCEALLGSLGLTGLFVGGAVLPQALDAACPALFDALGLGLAPLLVVGGAAWLCTHK